MQLTSVHIKNFRSFGQTTIAFDKKIVLVAGENGSGKTSLLEALHYLCYLRSFRTYSPKELVKFGTDTFFIKASVDQKDQKQEIQVGFSSKKRLVKINQKAISSYKELMDHYRIVTLTEDDIFLIKGAPEIRRTFLDQAIFLQNPGFVQTIKKFKKIVENRNSLLKSGRVNKELYDILTPQLWDISYIIRNERKAVLGQLQKSINLLISEYFDNQFELTFEYSAKKVKNFGNLEDFLASDPNIYNNEIRFCRSMFGAHLDDMTIKFMDKRSKTYASRGQQKLIVLLIKIAQIQELLSKKSDCIFLLDDFMTDFDEARAKKLLTILSDLSIQLIFTSPSKGGVLEDNLLQMGAQSIFLTD